jgi:16S rRNA (cytidine1402-2'-O)-methyltransferase
LEQLKNILGENRQIIVCRELTKQFETIYRGNINEVLESVKNDKIKGEFVIVVNHE